MSKARGNFNFKENTLILCIVVCHFSFSGSLLSCQSNSLKRILALYRPLEFRMLLLL